MSDPSEYLWMQVGGTSETEPGSVGQHLRPNGWRKTVANLVRPALDRMPADAGVVTHHAFGQWCGFPCDMEIDSYDFASSAGLKWLANEFSAAWRPITESRVCLAYVGSVDQHPRLSTLPIPELAKVIRRNVKPYKDAGFAGVILDASCDAVSHDAWYQLDPNKPADAKGNMAHVPRNLNSFTLHILDGEFERRTGIEMSPRSFSPWADLCTRESWMLEPQWRQQHGYKNEQHPLAKFQGRGEPGYLKGRAHRVVYRNHVLNDATLDTEAKFNAAVDRVRKDGQVPAYWPWTK